MLEQALAVEPRSIAVSTVLSSPTSLRLSPAIMASFGASSGTPPPPGPTLWPRRGWTWWGALHPRCRLLRPRLGWKRRSPASLRLANRQTTWLGCPPWAPRPQSMSRRSLKTTSSRASGLPIFTDDLEMIAGSWGADPAAAWKAGVQTNGAVLIASFLANHSQDP